MLQEQKNFEHKKSLGQNFLTSDVVPNYMCDAGEVNSLDTILEIGPGTGALTKILLERGATVHAIETDARAVLILTTTFADYIAQGKLILQHQDVREYPLSDYVQRLPNYKVVANIPYYLSGFLLRTCLELSHPPSTLVFLMQKEVVTRIVRDKKQSLLSLSVEVYGTPKYYKTITKGHFNPSPNVDSAILLVNNISHHHLPNSSDRDAFFEILHIGLGKKRKQLLGCLAEKYPRHILEDIFNEIGFSLTIRGEDIPLKDWLVLYKKLLHAQVTP